MPYQASAARLVWALSSATPATIAQGGTSLTLSKRSLIQSKAGTPSSSSRPSRSAIAPSQSAMRASRRLTGGHPSQPRRRHLDASTGQAPRTMRRSRRSPQLRGADVSGESLNRRWARITRLLPVVLAIGIAAFVVAGCGGSDKTDSISSEAQNRIEKGSEEAQKGIEKAKEEVKKGFNEAEEAAKKGVENGKGQTNKTIENAKKEAEEGIEKGKEEAESAIKEAEKNYGN
jgi:F0F1-type ATP synthase membrane subunit b/b'